jgi:hypothetical protein
MPLVRKSDGTYHTTTPVTKRTKRAQKEAKRANTPGPKKGGLMLTRELDNGSLECTVMEVYIPTSCRPWIK